MQKNKRSRVLRTLVLLPLFLFITAYQLRSSRETIHVARHLDYYVPFLMEPFSNDLYRVSDPFGSDHPAAHDKWGIQGAALQLVAINHRSFDGLSVYLTQLWDHRHFSLSLRYGGSPPFEAQYLFGHCTCSVSTVWELVQVLVLPPFTCILLAFVVLWRRPDSMLLWALATLLLSLSQIELFPVGIGFRWMTDTMTWPDSFRIPATAYRAFLQNIWPAALLVFAAHLFSRGPTVRRVSVGTAVPLLGVALLHTVLAIAWSENYRPFVPLYRWLDDHNTELITIGLGFVVLLSLLLNWMSGVTVAVLSLMATSALYWPPRPITGGSLIRLQNVFWIFSPLPPEPSQAPTLFLPSIPTPLVLPAFVVAVFAMVSFAVVCVCEWRQLKPVLSFSIVLLLPPAVFVLGVMQGQWTLWQPLPLMNTFTVCTGVGLVGVCRYCLGEKTANAN